jgi:hypothetical protein
MYRLMYISIPLILRPYPPNCEVWRLASTEEYVIEMNNCSNYGQ